MIKTVVIGGSGSGKSNFSENLTLLKNTKKLYIATMEPFSKEAKVRIKKHKKLRQNKNFFTKECYKNVDKLRIDSFYDFILLECVSNLISNYMFIENKSDCINYVQRCIDNLSQHCNHLIFVSNDVSCDVLHYDDLTISYIKNLCDVNCFLIKSFNNVFECQYNNIITHKGGGLNEKCCK